MLLTDFYQFNPFSVQQIENRTKLETEIVLNPAHAIFKGHFPNLPIVPGVCMVQIVKEIVEMHLGKKLFLESAGTIKFLAMLNPEAQQRVNVEVEVKSVVDNKYEVDGKFFFGATTFFKMKADFLVHQ
jgi:3-hydroxyacyl-[acyl-carrier-protein] dehydratase